jgi:hypothetical protein
LALPPRRSVVVRSPAMHTLGLWLASPSCESLVFSKSFVHANLDTLLTQISGIAQPFSCSLCEGWETRAA